MTEPTLCPCGSERDASTCCLPIIRGEREATTAEELLRARYTAFTRAEMGFVRATHHSKTREQVNDAENEEWAKKSTWLGLKVMQKEGGEKNDTQGIITFSAQYRMNNRTHDHLERSVFEKEDGKWKFLDIQPTKTGTLRRTEPKVGRNDACPCGSGKKYKKCCA